MILISILFRRRDVFIFLPASVSHPQSLHNFRFLLCRTLSCARHQYIITQYSVPGTSTVPPTMLIIPVHLRDMTLIHVKLQLAIWSTWKSETAASRSYLHATVSWLLGWFSLVCWSAPVLSSCSLLLCEESPLPPALGVRHCMVHWCLFHRAQHRPGPPASFHRCLLGPCDVSISPWWEVFLPCVHTSPLGILSDDAALALTLAMHHLSPDLL
jgi:hypothetical protein